MKVLITHFKKDDKGNTLYYDNRPLSQVTAVKLPLKFGYGSYNEPKKLLNTGIDVSDIISIESEGELNLSI